MDIGTLVALGGISLTVGGVVKRLLPEEIVKQLLGPSSEYIGIAARDSLKYGVENVGRILCNTCERLGNKLADPGLVHPRVLKGIVDEGRVVDDVFSVEYFGGLLASARTADTQDDSAIAFLSTVKSLSSHQLRLHFIIYCLVAKHFFNRSEIEAPDFWSTIELRIRRDELLQSLDLDGVDGYSHMALALAGLTDSQLVRGGYSIPITYSVGDNHVRIRPNERGACLFLRALGLRGSNPAVLASLVVESCLSEAITGTLSLPQQPSFAIRPQRDPFSELQEHFEDKVFELESTVEELKDELEKLQSEREESLADAAQE